MGPRRLTPRFGAGFEPAAAAAGRGRPASARRAVDLLDLDRDDPLSRWDGAVLPECARADAGRLVDALRTAGPALPAGERADLLRRALAPVVQGKYPDGAARLAETALACCDRTAAQPETAAGPALGLGSATAPAARVAADLDALWV